MGPGTGGTVPIFACANTDTACRARRRPRTSRAYLGALHDDRSRDRFGADDGGNGAVVGSQFVALHVGWIGHGKGLSNACAAITGAVAGTGGNAAARAGVQFRRHAGRDHRRACAGRRHLRGGRADRVHRLRNPVRGCCRLVHERAPHTCAD